MICPNCSHVVPDDEMFCKNCGTALKKSKKKEFVINIPEEETLNYEPETETSAIESVIETVEPSQSEAEKIQPEEKPAEEPTVIDDELILHQAIDEIIIEPESKPEPKPKMPAKPHHAPAKGKTKKKDPQKKTYVAIKLIASFCAIAIVLLTGLSAYTDIFEDNPNKTVVFSGLSSEQKVSFEEYASKLTPLFEGGYNSKTIVFDDVLDLIQPNSSRGLYAGFFKKKKAVTDESDPIGRYKNGDDGYNYCKVSEKDIEQIAESLNLDVYHDANTADCYYYDGYYYFNANSSTSSKSKLTLKVDDAKQTQSGDYYVTCGLYSKSAIAEDGTVSGEPKSKQYFLVSLETEAETTNWIVHEISNEPIIEQTIVSIKDKDTNNEETPETITSLDFEMRSETITVKTSSGDIYAQYIVEYPYFESVGITQTAINNIYSELIESYKAQNENADKLYDKYIKDGYNKSDLPIYNHIVSRIVYNDAGYISLLERRTESNPTLADSEEETTSRYSSTSAAATQTSQETISLDKTVYEGYTYVIESGDFVKKDEVLGKDYQQTYKTLYEIYYNSKHEDAETVPDDTDKIGEAIYSSAWMLTEKGVMFCYQNQDGALDKVILPYKQIENMAIDVK
ncbi:MAG: hypothetical protein NC122_02820 [Faecalibacterium sp.]|nr:hypothetical protein [Ruminococcus sp.]MCM1391560.1 hypothetical protein [Ruminococcus sp.]MCM1485117.1 hypothetical protein [Faecalibacterium sp.]